ncbi:MAG: methyltransferase domain-containing protein [Planctomycetes bacterium]|nr:methyltransferase domain-containing protein [Planctomycetota bacterium]
MQFLFLCFSFAVVVTTWNVLPSYSQEKSVRPGIKDTFRDPNVDEFIGKFEVESREVYLLRQEILAACEVKPGATVADVGAGTGLFTRLFSEAVGDDGHVLSVDISQKFLDPIQATNRQLGLRNVDTLLCTADSTKLPENKIDLAYICDTYHHFEFPTKTMESLFRAMVPGGRLVLIDFRREEGKSTDWVMNHVRAGQSVFEKEVTSVGFKKIANRSDVLKENYLVIFEKPKP